MGSSPSSLDPIVIPLVQGPRILDVGCGFGRWGCLCTCNYWETSQPLPASRPKIVGLDGFAPNLRMASGSGCYAAVLQGVFPPLPFRDRSFDTVLLVEVLEHVPGALTSGLIREAQRIARKRVILSTPGRPSLRGAHATITGFNPLEAHLSHTSRSELRGMGFRLYGAGFSPGPAPWRRLLRRLGLLAFYDRSMRPCLSGFSYGAPCLAETVIGLWKRDDSRDRTPGRDEVAEGKSRGRSIAAA